MGRRLGQHFLTDQITLKKIVALLNIDGNDTVIEIGPGHGELTLEIKNQISKIKDNSIKIIAIEKDEKLAKNLELRIKDLGLENIEIIHGDALKEIKYQKSKIKNTNQKSKIIGNLKIVGNIPYYITGYLLRTLGELDNKPSLIVLTTQKEVAERICAGPPQMNLLAASIQVWAEPKIEMIIKRGLFSPPPKVDSAVIRLVIKEPTIESEIYYPFIKALFKQPRKTILNNISFGLDLSKAEVERLLITTKISPAMRPQALSISQITSLARVFKA